MHPNHITPELLARADDLRRAVDKHSEAARKLSRMRVPPGLTLAAVQVAPGMPIERIAPPQPDPARMAVFFDAAERMRPFFEQHRAAEARRPEMPTEFLEN